jgi:5,10-methylenetetrahydrofolate reductase
MQFGPCGGVRPDGGCELGTGPCVFPEPVPWPGRATLSPPAAAPLVVTDVSASPFDADDLTAVAGILATSCDAVLVGEHQNRPDYPPTLLAQLLLGAGAHPWITLACRDRNRIVLEQELRGLAAVGADTVLCVTGDARGGDVRPEITQVFDLDGTRLAALAASLGLSAAVPETPTAPPVRLRAQRLVQKQHAGASIAVLNHTPRPDDVGAFMADARTAGLGIPVLAAVTVFTDATSAAVLRALPGLGLDEDVVARVLGSADPVEAGIAAAVEEAEHLLAVEGVVGVNVSGLASGQGSRVAAEIKAEVGRRVRQGRDDS